jgi:hypothetical protein
MPLLLACSGSFARCGWLANVFNRLVAFKCASGCDMGAAQGSMPGSRCQDQLH